MGLVRCHALLDMDGRYCLRLIWPGQTTRGDGDEQYHARCLERQNAVWEEMDRMFDAGDTLTNVVVSSVTVSAP